MINKVATTHFSFLRLQIKREDIIDKCRECDKDSSIHNFKGCLYRVKQINLSEVYTMCFLVRFLIRFIIS
jgi:hypothetical protein